MLHKTLIFVTLLFIQGQAIIYDGTPSSWMQYEKWNLCPDTNKAMLALTVNTSDPNGLLVYMDGGESNTDYLLVELHDGKVYLEYQYGTGNDPAVNTRDDQGVPQGEITVISIERVRMGFILKIDENVGANQLLPNYGSDLCFGDCNGGLDYDLSPGNSDLYIGGVPPAVRARAQSRVKSRALDNPFVGEIYDINYKNCKSIPLNPKIVEKGSSINPASDVCYGETHPICICKRSDTNDQCLCLTCVESIDEDDVKHYSIATFGQRDEVYVVNYDGLDDKVVGDVIIEGEEHQQYLRLGDRTYFQFAGESQRDECLGNLDLCTKGYTLSFWLVILNSNLEMRDSILVNNGGSTSHGITVYWRNNALHTEFVMPNGQMWKNVAYELYPAQVYYETVGDEEQYNNYWYHYAVTWSKTNGLQVYLNGISVGTASVPSPSYKQGFVAGLRSSFMFGSDSSSANNMGISDIHFYSTYYSAQAIVGLKGVRHYYFTMNRVDGYRVVAWPRSLQANIGPLWDRNTQMVQGVADMALRLGARSSGQESYINAGDCSATCFGQASTCSFYISFWVKFDIIKHGITVLDTGNTGITIQIRNNALMALIYDTSDPIELTFPNVRANQWYFVEVDRIPSLDNSLWINGQIVSRARFGDWSRADLRHNGVGHVLLIGKRNADSGNTYKTDGWFTIDQLDMLQGDREYLRYIGHIQRGIPPHIFYTMDQLWTNNTRYVDYFYQHIQHNPMGQIIESRPGSGFVPGKDMWALSLYGNGSVFEITQSRRKEECYNNIEKCVHGILIRGWFNIETLRQNAGFMSSGFNGIDMAYRGNRLLVTASTLAKTWEVSVPGLDIDMWMFLEVSFHPKYGLTVYRDESNIGESLNGFSDQIRTPPATSRFVVGQVDGGVQVPMLVDNLEIWYGDRDYVCSQPNIPCTTDGGDRSKHFIIDFDEWDPRSGGRELQHELLTIPATGTLIAGLFGQALDVNGGYRDGAEVTYILPNTLVADECFGNLALCPDGFTVSFFVKPDRNFLDSSNQAIYLLSTGTNGIDVYVMNRKLYAEARNGDRQWQVQSPENFPVEELWNQIIVMWSPIMGLVLARDDKFYVIDRDINGRFSNEVDTSLDSRYLIGSVNPTVSHSNNFNGLQVAYDEMIIDYYYKVPTPITHDSFSFERTNSWYSSKVEHPKFQVWLRNGAGLVEGLVGNTSTLDGTNQYIDLGEHTDSCIDNLDLCDSNGVTMSFKVKIRRGSSQGDQVVLTGNSYDINIVDGRRLQVLMMTKDKLWNMDMRSFNNLPVDEWIPIDVTWTEERGARLFINGSLRFEDRQSEPRPQQSQRSNLLVGRATGGSRYFNGEVDEIHFYRSTYEELSKKGIITHQCGYYGMVVDMEEIDANGVVASSLSNPVVAYFNPRTVPALVGRGIELLETQYIDVGSRLSCQSRPNACLNGYTMRVSIKPTVLARNSYLVSSNPAEIVYGFDGNLQVRYSSLSGVWEATLSDVMVNVWYSIDISWDDENGLTVYVNNVQRAWSQNASYPISNRYNQNNHFYINRPSSSFVTNYAGSNFVVDNLEVWDAKRELLRACGLLRDLSVRHHATFPNSANGYIRLFYIPQEYNIKSVQDEQLFLRFLAQHKDGLLWYNEDGDIRSYIYLQDGDLYFGTTEEGGSPSQRRITFGQLLNDGLDHTLTVKSERGNQLTFYLDGIQRQTVNTEHLVRFLTGDFHIGGHLNATKVTNGKVRDSFVGIFKDAKINGTGFDVELDLFKEMWKEQFPDYVRVSCDENYETLVTFDPEIDPICDVRGTAVTFIENSTYIYEDVWSNQGNKPSIKLRFTPAEPKGLLLFTGTKTGNNFDEFFALELYDRLLYLVTDVGNGPVRKQVSPSELEDMNVPHSTEIIFDADARKIIVYFDEMRREEADVPMGNVRSGENVFEGRIYIGGYVGYPDHSSLPWHIWSEAGFVGCVTNLQINTLSSDLQSLYITQKAQHIVDGCRAFDDHCASDPCFNSAPCYNRKDRYECDCTGLTYGDYQNALCAELTLIGNIDGNRFYDIDLGRTYKTHVNDFSTRFKTIASDGTMWMTHSPVGSEYIKAFFEGGELKVSIDTGRQSFVLDTDGVYNDYEWHVLNVRRRGNEITVWVDDRQQGPVVIGDQDFYISMDEIRLGADTPVAVRPYFFGHLNNFRWPNSTDRTPPFTDPYPIPVPHPSITFRTSQAYISVPNVPDEMLTGFKVILMLKTQLKDALFLYQPGRYDQQYLAGLLKDGYLNIRFNFGGADELISVDNLDLSDDKWHIIEIYRKTSNKLQVRVDNKAPVSKDLPGPLQFDHSRIMYLGGIPAGTVLPDGLRHFYQDGVDGYKGCMAKLVKNRLLVDITDEKFQDADIRGKDVVVTGCEPWESCIESECLHGCTCGPADSACDNSIIPFNGKFCQHRDPGFTFHQDGSPGRVIFRYDFVTSVKDMISFGFKACEPNGILAKFSGSNEEFIKIYLENGNIEAMFRLGSDSGSTLTLNGDYTDNWYIVQLEREGTKATLSVLDDTTGNVLHSSTQTISSVDSQLNDLQLLEIGSEYRNGNYVNPYSGIITGFKHGGYNIFEVAMGPVNQRTQFTSTGTAMERKPDNFTCVVPAGCGPGKQECMNFGVCQNNVCNCTLTGYSGSTCEDYPKGHYYGYKDWQPGLDVYKHFSPVTTYEDYFAVGLMTDEKYGTIFRVENIDKSQYYHLRLDNGSVRLDFNLDNSEHTIHMNDFTVDSSDDIYYIIRLNRTRENITFTVHHDEGNLMSRNQTIAGLANVPFRSQNIIMSGGKIRRTSLDEIEDDYYGILGGMYYNSRYLYDLFYDNINYNKSGTVAQAPHPFHLLPRETPDCPKCDNHGTQLANKQCDCTYTSYGGLCCNEMDELLGFRFKKYGGDAIVIYNISAVGRDENDLAVSFKTASGWGDGQIMKVVSKDQQYYIIVELKDDKLQVRYKLGAVERVQEFDANVRQQNHHRVRVHSAGAESYIQLDDYRINIDLVDTGIFKPDVIYIGGEYDGSATTLGYYGIIWKPVFNGIDIVEEANKKDVIKTGKFTVKTEGDGNFEIIPYPWPDLCDKGAPDCDTPPPPPSIYGGGGAIIINIPTDGAPVPIVSGGSGTGVVANSGAVIGAIMGGLLFASAIAFAAAGMKPGFFTLSKGMAGAGGGGMYVPVYDEKPVGGFPVSNGNIAVAVGMDDLGAAGSQAGTKSQYEDSYMQESQFDATDTSMAGGAAMGAGGAMAGQAGYNSYNTSSTWYARDETLENQNQGAYGAGSTMGGYGRGAYAGSVAGGSVAGSVYGFGTVTNPDQAFITLSEDIAVDNVVLTADGRYVVTGSNLGPPQVWNTTNGEMVTTMRGDHMGSTGLHLAANEQYLIGETMAEQAAVDMNDIQTGNHIPIRRVAVWDFNTGNPLPIAVDQLCTASCVSKDGFKVVMAMTDKFGGGTTIKVLDLLSNKVLNEMTYPDTIGVADSASCVFMSPDDRFVAVGFTNSFDGNANFIIFDLFNKSSVVDSPIVALNGDPHCTVILKNDEALTGTKNGELVIWSMKTGKAQRQLTSGDATMLSQGGMPAAHDREVKEVSLSHDGKYLASASADRTVKVWSMDSESLLHTLHGHNDEVWTVDIASDNSIIVSGSQDGTIKLWRLRNGNQVTSFNATMDIFHARFSKDKKTVVALGDKYGARKLIMLQIVSQKKWRMRSS